MEAIMVIGKCDVCGKAVMCQATSIYSGINSALLNAGVIFMLDPKVTGCDYKWVCADCHKKFEALKKEQSNQIIKFFTKEA